MRWTKRFKFDREYYIPKGATKVSDKKSDAIAYLYPARSAKNVGKVGAAIFFGKQAKPVANYIYRDEARRAAAITEAFESRRKALAYKKESRAKKSAWIPDYKVGDLLKTNWGYDQTNVEYFEVTEIKGKHLILREIAQETVQTGHDQGKCVPLPGHYLNPRYDGDDQGLPIRRLAQEGGVRICSVRWASRCKPDLVGNIPVYAPTHYSWGH